MIKSKREPMALAAAVPGVALLLAQTGHRHALIGGIAVGVWVEPRATKDIDFVIGARVGDVDDVLLAARKAGFDVRAQEVDRLKASFMTRLWTPDTEGEPVRSISSSRNIPSTRVCSLERKVSVSAVAKWSSRRSRTSCYSN